MKKVFLSLAVIAALTVVSCKQAEAPAEDAAAAVDSVLAIIGNEGEDISGLTGGAAAPAAATEEKKSEEGKKVFSWCIF